jgi:hypothetical protein
MIETLLLPDLPTGRISTTCIQFSMGALCYHNLRQHYCYCIVETPVPTTHENSLASKINVIEIPSFLLQAVSNATVFYLAYVP